MRTLLLTIVSSLTFVVGCDPFAPFNPLNPAEPEATGDECGEAPASFDQRGDIVQGAAAEGCVRIERHFNDEGIVAPQRLVIHADGFSRRYDVDTTELTYEASDGNMSDVITTTTDDDVAVRIQIDICTGEWTLSVDEDEVLLPVLGA